MGGKAGTVAPQSEPADAALVGRIAAAYSASLVTMASARDSVWLSAFADMKAAMHAILASGETPRIALLLRDPAASTWFYGFDGLAQNLLRPDDPAWMDRVRFENYDSLLRLAEAVGAYRLENPETPAPMRAVPDVEEILAAIDRRIGIRLDFPNPFPREVGLVTSRGIASYRALQAVYQAWRIGDLLAERRDARVLEIGAGLGWTAYYAWRLGIRDYTIIDIPMTAAAQAYFLGRVLGDGALRLYGETGEGCLRILPPVALLDGDDRYDLVLNVDSLPEMSRKTAQRYWDAIAARAGVFLSINHEANDVTVRDLYSSGSPACVCRAPYWMRRGYVEEVIRF